MKSKKVMALLLAAAMTGSMSASCITVSAADEPITLTYYDADGTNNAWDNPVSEAITAATGVTLDVTYPVGTSDGTQAEDIALMIAEDNYPDMIFAKGSATDLYEAGALIDMTDLIDEYGSNIKKMYGEEFSKLKWGNGDDGIYQLSYADTHAQTLQPSGTCQIQWAALKENNYEYPKTIAEYEALIKKYLEAHPTTDDGLPMIGLSISASDWHWMITLGNPAGFIADAKPDNGQWIYDDDNNFYYKHASEDEKEYFQWLCRMYNEGILDPDFATQTHDDYIAKLSSGRVVAITDTNWDYASAESVLISDGKVDKTYAPLPVTLHEGDKAPTLMYQGLQVGWGIGITKSCKDPVRAIKFLDYICSDEGQILFNWGVEGINYEVDENGNRYRTEEEITASKTDPDYSKKTGIRNFNGFPNYGDGATAEDGTPYTPNTRETIIAAYNEEQKAACEAWGVEMLIDIFPQPDEFETPAFPPVWALQPPQELSNMISALDEIAWPGLVKCVTGTEADFEANWTEMVSALEANGMEEANAQMTEFVKGIIG